MYLFLDEPYIVNSGPQNAHLRGSRSIDNFELHLERNKNISFIAYKDYRCCEPSQSNLHALDHISSFGSSNLLTGESVAIISPELQSALQALAEQAFNHLHPPFELDKELNSPYLWWYHSRPDIERVIKGNFLDFEQNKHVTLFQQHLLDQLGTKWVEVDHLLANNHISFEFINYLFVSLAIILSLTNSSSYLFQNPYF